MPRDQWKFVTTNEEFDDALEPEEAAVHLEGDSVPPPAEDPGRAEVTLGDDSEGGLRSEWFADEEPDDPALAELLVAASDDEDLEELLEEQHYAFAPDPEELAD